MSDRKQNNLRMVESDAEAADTKKKKRRRRTGRIIFILVIICVAAVVAYILLARYSTYDRFTVTDEVERSDTSATHYLAFGNGYVKYSNDGAVYVTDQNVNVWNQSYEMENPVAVVCGSYIAFADRQGESVFVLDESGLQGEITANHPISRIDVAAQGTVAVLTADSETGYLALYDKTGGQIAEGAIHVENTGTVMDIALSEDGKNLAADIVDVSAGTARTTINFYNFSTAGQNQIDNLVGTLQYPDTIIPEITYAGETTLLAFADAGVYVFEGGTSPRETGMVEAEDEIHSIFYDDSYFGLVYSAASDAGRVIHVYDTGCRERALIETDFSYNSIGFLDNHEICMYNNERCDLYTVSGARKMSCEFEEDVVAFFHRSGYRNYLVLTENATQRIRLKLFDHLFGSRSEAAEAAE